MSPHEIDGKFSFKCDKCGFTEEAKDSLVIKNKIKKPEKIGEGVINDRNIFATYKHKCEKCGYDKVQVLDLGIFYSDEDNLIMLKCGSADGVRGLEGRQVD